MLGQPRCYRLWHGLVGFPGLARRESGIHVGVCGDRGGNIFEILGSLLGLDALLGGDPTLLLLIALLLPCLIQKEVPIFPRCYLEYDRAAYLELQALYLAPESNNNKS